MLGRIAQLRPDWRERSPADLGVTLVEMLAYTADRLSYAQDAVATEAYLATARRRSSVRRHARLVDYRMHDGANARVWVHLETDADAVVVNPATDRFLTRLTGFPPAITDPDRQRDAFNLAPQVFQPLHAQALFVLHNAMPFYNGATASAACARARRGRRWPGTSRTWWRATSWSSRSVSARAPAAPPTPTPRCGTRCGSPPSKAASTDEVTGAAITEIRWAEEDALPFPFCISSRLDDSAGGGLATEVSHALGNIVLADHGLAIAGEDLGACPSRICMSSPAGGDPCGRSSRSRCPALPAGPAGGPGQPGRGLRRGGAVGLRRRASRPRRPPPGRHAARRHAPQPRATGGATGSAASRPPTIRTSWWRPKPTAARAIRFGDDRNGLRPTLGRLHRRLPRRQRQRRQRRRGGIRHVVTGAARIDGACATRCRRPAASIPKAWTEVRQRAPVRLPPAGARRHPEDYAEVALRHPDVQRAAATFRWTGSGHTVFVTVDRFGGRAVDAGVRGGAAGLPRAASAWRATTSRSTRRATCRSRSGCMVCVDARPLPLATSRAACSRAARAARLPDGAHGLFHPDNLTLRPAGLPEPRSMRRRDAVDGVESRRPRRSSGASGSADPAPARRRDRLGRLEIARLDNDPSFPERGVDRTRRRGAANERAMRIGHPDRPPATDLRLLRRDDARHAAADRQSRRTSPPSRTGSAHHGRFKAVDARQPGLRRHARAGAACRRVTTTTSRSR